MSSVGTPLIMTRPSNDLQRTREATSASTHTLSSPETWVDLYGDAMFAFTVAQVRDAHVAEDLVQDALLAAYGARASFEGQSHERTWLIGILKHKIIDHLRRTARERDAATAAAAASSSDPELPHFMEHFFDRKRGKWKDTPMKWAPEPTQDLENREFWKVVHACIGRLAPNYAEVFCLREMSQMRADELCEVLGISASNFGVRMHRARLLLRTCLERHWFSDRAS